MAHASSPQHAKGRGALTVEIVLRPPTLSIARLSQSLARLPHYRELFFVLTMHRLRVRYRQSALGPAWAILQPVAMMLIFTAVFAILSPASPDRHPYAVFAYAGLLPWTAFASSLASGSASLTTNAALVTRVAFPREILPATYVASALCDLLVASTVLMGMLAYYDVALTAHALWAIPTLILLAGCALGLVLTLAAINVHYRDVSVGMPLLLQFWMFASPVIYPLQAVPDAWRPIYLLNPMAGIVDSFRRALLDGTPPDAAAFGSALAVTLVILPASYMWFKHLDATMADRI
jgi:lipopolysaccharide transport system permease protein